jgi:hypothetical protein
MTPREKLDDLKRRFEEPPRSYEDFSSLMDMYFHAELTEMGLKGLVYLMIHPQSGYTARGDVKYILEKIEEYLNEDHQARK